jgi:hypothetical protein
MGRETLNACKILLEALAFPGFSLGEGVLARKFALTLTFKSIKTTFNDLPTAEVLKFWDIATP